MIAMNETVSEPWAHQTEESDTDLVRRARSGESEALDVLVRRHRQSAYVFALQLLGNRDDALDAAQDALLRFVRSLDRFDSHRPVRPWLLTIVRNVVRDLWRKRAHSEVNLPAADDGPDLASQLVDPRSNPERDLRTSELRRRVWRAIDRLPEKKREILVLRDFHDHSYAEIAEILEIPMGTVMSRLHGARRAVGKLLGRDVLEGSRME